MADKTSMREQAIAWAVRAGDPGFEDWDGFTAWLEQDPNHAAAYDAAVLAIDDAAVALPAIPQAANDEVTPGRRPRWVGGAMVAALTAVAAFGVWQVRDGSYAIETQPGEMRVVELDGGSRIAVAGDTRIVLDRSDPRMASLERGQALFTVEHDAQHPFQVAVGGDTLVDVGTVFEVERTGDHTSVAVSEGAVDFNPSRQNVRLRPGQVLRRDTAADSVQVAAIAPAQIGEWAEGRLTFTDASLTEVAGDLARATGAPFVAAPGSAERRVSGSLVVAPVKADPRTVGPLLGVGVRYNGQAWEIGAQ